MEIDVGFEVEPFKVDINNIHVLVEKQLALFFLDVINTLMKHLHRHYHYLHHHSSLVAHLPEPLDLCSFS